MIGMGRGESVPAQVADDATYRRLDGFDHSVWWKEDRTSVTVVAVVGRWRGSLDINTSSAITEDGPLDMSEPLLHRSVDFLIDLTEFIAG